MFAQTEPRTDEAVYDLPFFLVESGHAEKHVDLVQRRRGFAWREAALAVVAAAEAGHAEQLSAALAYFTRVGATSHVERCDTLSRLAAEPFAPSAERRADAKSPDSAVTAAARWRA